MCVITTSPETFIPNQQSNTSSTKPNLRVGPVAVAEHSPQVLWVIQDLNVPISVLLHNPGFKDANCTGLKDELLHLPVTGKSLYHPEDLSLE